ncbi:hypothetical protein EXM65_15910 [Clostridium botulinum]|uniref:Uncharacterized protein n=1 Tax=Clostridium botulinum TaxID=1491 RepID=A0A6M0SRR7_CLOBO|nr:hypothetical protein [Clostridium botulinum]
MYEHKTIINKDGFIIENCVLFIDNIPQYFEITEDMQIVDMPNKTYIKPKWTGIEWVEGATEEEIKEYEENNKPKPKEPTETELLQKQLLETQALVAELRYKTILKENGGI